MNLSKQPKSQEDTSLPKYLTNFCREEECKHFPEDGFLKEGIGFCLFDCHKDGNDWRIWLEENGYRILNLYDGSCPRFNETVYDHYERLKNTGCMVVEEEIPIISD